MSFVSTSMGRPITPRKYRKVSSCDREYRLEPQLRLAASYRKEVATMTRRIAHAAPLVALVLALALVPAAVAAKGGSGASTGGSGVAFTFDPGVVSVGMTYQVHVSGLRANTWTTVGAYYIASDAAYWCSGTTDGAGNFSCPFTAEKAGSILHETYQKTSNRYRLKGSTYLDVSP